MVTLDWEITEVYRDDSGLHHGNEYGHTLASMTERRNITNKARRKLQAISKKIVGSKPKRPLQ